MTHLKNPYKSLISNEKKVEKNVKKRLTFAGKPVGWYHKLIKVYIMKGQTLC